MNYLYSKLKDRKFTFDPHEMNLFLEEHGNYTGYFFHKINRTTTRRTNSQSNALHLWYKLVADSLNEAGLDVQTVLSKKMGLDWNPALVKELWRDAQRRIVQKESTTQLDKVSEIDLIRDHFIRHFAEKFEGYELPEFPNDPNKIK